MSVTSKVRKATETVAKAFVPDEKGAGDIDILATLEKEHDAMKMLLFDLQAADAAVDRLALVRKIKLLLVPHMEAEEKVVYGAVIALKDADAQIDGHAGSLEHEWASKTLERLDGISDAASAEHKAAAKVLMDLVEHHILEEESNIWSDLEEHFSEDDRARMNLEFQMAKKQVHVV
jgi:Hemerythrin HHE cation binding domain